MGGRSGDICFNILNYIVNRILNSDGNYISDIILFVINKNIYYF